MGRECPPYEARLRLRSRLERCAAIRFKRLQEEEPNQYCHQTAAELFRWSASLYFCNGVRIRYGDHEYYVRLLGQSDDAKAKAMACIDAKAKFIDGSPSFIESQTSEAFTLEESRKRMDQGSKS